jgi:hypothetical protein
MIKKYRSLVSKVAVLSAIGVFIPMFSTTAETQWPSGYYRQSNSSYVYYLNSSNSTYCHVQNESQMEAFGGFRRVRVVGGSNFLVGSRNIGECDWPNGGKEYRQSQQEDEEQRIPRYTREISSLLHEKLSQEIALQSQQQDSEQSSID